MAGKKNVLRERVLRSDLNQEEEESSSSTSANNSIVLSDTVDVSDTVELSDTVDLSDTVNVSSSSDSGNENAAAAGAAQVAAKWPSWFGPPPIVKKSGTEKCGFSKWLDSQNQGCSAMASGAGGSNTGYPVASGSGGWVDPSKSNMAGESGRVSASNPFGEGTSTGGQTGTTRKRVHKSAPSPDSSIASDDTNASWQSEREYERLLYECYEYNDEARRRGSPNACRGNRCEGCSK